MREQFLPYLDQLFDVLATSDGEWIVKGFIDIHQNIYTISVDTKVISKIIELMLIPVITQFASENQYQVVLSNHQNHYPDVTLIAPDNSKIAIDLKSTYRTSATSINGFTLGAFTGYFRNRASSKNVTFPYAEYQSHYVLGTIYSRQENAIDENHVYTLDDLSQIPSVIYDFTFLFREKWQLASAQTGSGNTKNIGSAKHIQKLIDGEGDFAPYGEAVFDHYWMNYLTADMARAIDSVVPYRNLDTYFRWRK